jgi:endoglucanase
LQGLPDSLKKQVLRNKLVYNIDSIRHHFKKPIAAGKKYNLPLYCGEWGCLNTVPEAARLQWYNDMKKVLEENNIGWATWDYKGGFGIIDRNKKEEKELIKILTSK